MSWIRNLVTLAVAMTWMFSASAWAAGGYVLDAVGDVSVAVGKAEAQPAKKNDAIVAGAVVHTGDKSHAVLKFEDGQVVVMQANSSFHVREYSYDSKQVEKSNIFFAMLKGGMRFVTGLIGQHNKTAFRLGTPNATIGIRGTDFMVAMGNSPMYSQVMSGSIGMTNAAGTTVFTAGQAAVVASATTLPAAISVAAIPAGTFTQLVAIPVPPPTPVTAPAPAGGAATGGATASTSTAATATTGISATTVGIGVGVAAGVAAIANTTTTTHHP
jgi:hypothetical protein